MSHLQHLPVDRRIAEEAAHWLIELEDGTADLSCFTSWLEASPRHVEEFLLASALWNTIGTVDGDREIDVDALVVRARDNVQPLEIGLPTAREVPQRRTMRRGWLGAAVAALCLAGVFWASLSSRALQYATAVGEQRIFKLPDGSVVTLNTRSRIEVRFADTQRVVELVAGEALFDVEHDAERPFSVLAGGAVVRAIGTQFNVHRTASSTTVSVLQGVVQVSSLDASRSRSTGTGRIDAGNGERLKAGEQAQVSPSGSLLRASAEIERVMAWRERRLVFRDQPLADVAREFNRYNDTQLIVEGTATRARRMTGVFDADDPGALIAFLERDPVLSVNSREGSIVIRGP